jgi:asparagine synthase (glutamine-hydrolysing)
VLISGEGGDETLGGYTRYEPVRYPTLIKFSISPLGAPARFLLRLSQRQNMRNLGLLFSLNNLYEIMLFNSARVLPRDLQKIGYFIQSNFETRRAILDRAVQEVKEPIKQLMLYEIQTFLCSILDRNDRMTMASSIECRVPLLAVDVVEAALKLPVSHLFSGRYGKKILRDYASDLLPKEILKRPKWGLGIPWLRYFRHDPMCREFISDIPRTGLAKVLDTPRLADLIRDFLSGNDDNFQLVYQFFTLAVWWEQIIEKNSRALIN